MGISEQPPIAQAESLGRDEIMSELQESLLSDPEALHHFTEAYAEGKRMGRAPTIMGHGTDHAHLYIETSYMGTREHEGIAGLGFAAGFEVSRAKRRQL